MKSTFRLYVRVTKILFCSLQYPIRVLLKTKYVDYLIVKLMGLYMRRNQLTSHIILYWVFLKKTFSHTVVTGYRVWMGLYIGIGAKGIIR